MIRSVRIEIVHIQRGSALGMFRLAGAMGSRVPA